MTDNANPFNEKIDPSISFASWKNELQEQKEKVSMSDMFSISTQGWVFIGVTIAAFIFHSINPFGRIFASSLKAERYLSITLFIFFMVNVVILFLYDPFNLTNYFGLLTPIILGIGAFLLAIVLWYTLQFTDSDMFESAQPQKPSKITSIFMKAGLILGSIGLLAVIITYSVLNADKLTGASYIISLIFNIVIALAIIGFVYRTMSKSILLRSSPYTRLILNTLFYIPCIIFDIFESIIRAVYEEKDKTRKNDFIVGGFIILLCTLYVLVPLAINWIKKYRQGGKILLNEPIATDKKVGLGSYMELNDIPSDETDITYEYNYALSAWIYVYPSPPSVRSSLATWTPILDYGGKPQVLYNAKNNELMVTATLADLTEERITNANLSLDDDNNVIIYKQKNVLLQRWNNIIINFDKGVLDVFINGVLVKSVKNMVPYMTLDSLTVGSPNGVNGAICNVIYYNKPLTAMDITTAYETTKNMDPPAIPNATPNSVLLGKQR